MSYVVRIAINAIALWAAVYFVPNISFPAAEHFPANDWWKLVVVAAIFGLINAFVKPIVKLLSLPIRLATLGLFTFVINAALFLLLAAVSDRFDLGLKVGDFPPTLTLTSLVAAFLGALVITVVSTILNIAIRD